MDRKFAFTLAEVLVTLMIIGVIASMTIPALRQDAMNKTVATNLKKIYSELNQATSLTLTENHTNKMCRTGVMDDDETFEKEFINKKLNVMTTCNASSPEECFGKTELFNTSKSYLLSNGIAIAFDSVDCSSGTDIQQYIYIDINGPKPPNKGGSDQFIIEMNGFGEVRTTNQLSEDSREYCKSATDDYQAAWACARTIILDGWEVKY